MTHEKANDSRSVIESSPDQPRDIEALVELEGDLKLQEMNSEREKGELDGMVLKEIAQRNRIMTDIMRRNESVRTDSSDHWNSDHSNGDVKTLELDRQSQGTELYSPRTVIRRGNPGTNRTNRNSV